MNTADIPMDQRRRCRCGKVHEGDFWYEDTLRHECFHRHLFVIEYDAERGTVDIACGECGAYWACLPLRPDAA